jgi:TonB family protein
MNHELHNRKPLTDEDLRDALQVWEAPPAPPALDARALASYRQMFAVEELTVESPQNATLPAARHAALETEETTMMKTCPHCQEQFAARFGFCPVDGTALPETETAPALLYTRPEYHLTVLEDKGLTTRLARELRLLKTQLALAWPECKRDPRGFARHTLAATVALLANFFRSPYVLTAMVSAVLLVMSAVAAIALLDSWRSRTTPNGEQLEISQLINVNDIPKEEEPPKKEGAAGNNKGDGGGSKPKFEKPQGGGGGGREDEVKPVSKGETPPMSPEPQVVVPKVQPPPERPPLLPVMPTIKGDSALTRMPRNMQFGDPDSKSTDPSPGKGEGEGFGGGKGTGAGKGEGAGLGPGRGENTGGGDPNYGGGGSGGGGGGKPKEPEDYNRPFQAREVTRKAVITSKPEPGYTEDARKNNTTGVVQLRVLLGANGAVSSISPVSRLPNGLTEKAIEAARRIRFTPAQKDGRNVSQWIVLQYDFNIY